MHAAKHKRTSFCLPENVIIQSVLLTQPKKRKKRVEEKSKKNGNLIIKLEIVLRRKENNIYVSSLYCESSLLALCMVFNFWIISLNR